MFEFGKFFSNLTGTGAKTSPKKSPGIFADPIKVSLILAVVIILIIYFIFKDAVDEDENFFSIMFKASLFTIIPIVSIVFIHNKNLENLYEDKYSDKGAKEIASRSVKPDPEDVDVADVPPATPKTGTSGAKGAGEDDAGKDRGGKAVAVNITVNNSEVPVKSGAFKPPK